MSPYVVEINYDGKEEGKEKKMKCYIDGEHSTTKWRYANHSCDNNAVISKMIHPKNDIPLIWIKSIRPINENEEILVHYGDEYKLLLQEFGGCKCSKCIKK
mgnify:CR=1 FL=1